MKFIRLVKNHFIGSQQQLFITGSDIDTSAVYTDQFPEIMGFSFKHIIFHIFKVMYGINLTDMKILF